MNLGRGKMALLASMIASAINLGQTVDDDKRSNFVRQCRSVKSGFTSDNESKKRRNRRRYQLAFESRRRNRNR